MSSYSQPEVENRNVGCSPVDRIKADALRALVIEVLRTCYDPEIPVDIYALGLIYDVDVTTNGSVEIRRNTSFGTAPL